MDGLSKVRVELTNGKDIKNHKSKVMNRDIDNKLVVAISASALFDTKQDDSFYKEKGVEAYRQLQKEKLDNTFNQGVAFPFIKRLLKLNEVFVEERPVEVILFSRNSLEAGMRVMRSIKAYGLDISMAFFSSGEYIYQYLNSINASIFLSANEDHTRAAMEHGYAAGTVLPTNLIDSDDDTELRLAFDFDGVIASDDSEKIYINEGLDNYRAHEVLNAATPLDSGPLNKLLKKISLIQKLEDKKASEDKNYKRIIKTAIVTARNAPAHERILTTLENFDITVDTTILLGYIQKSRVLNVMKPHLFFDDDLKNFNNLQNIAAVHIPFGVKNGLN